LRPVIAVIVAPKVRRINTGAGAREESVLKKNNRGNNFCQVERRKHRGQDRPAITLGNQKWAGAAPILIIKPKKIIMGKI